jgi:hypothetical protein
MVLSKTKLTIAFTQLEISWYFLLYNVIKAN